MATYNGHKNWNHWNVSLWVNNDEGLYRMANFHVRNNPGNRARAASNMLDELQDVGITRTPDGARYSISSIRAAMRGM